MNDLKLKDFYLLLAGGVGAAKFIDGLRRIINSRQIKIVVNTGDDINLFGLQICPDVDIITYTLAEVVDNNKGWGFKEETFNCLEILKKYYNFGWFNAGDKDLATHIFRTDLLNRGLTKKEVTDRICEKLGVTAEVIPMCNETVETYIKTSTGNLHFEEYYIKHRCEPKIKEVIFRGIQNARLLPKIKEYIKNAKKIIICPSNPIVSIDPILQIQDMKKLISKVKKKVYAISPIIRGKTVKGPADKLMRSVGLDVSSYGVANFYSDLISHIIIDEKDKELRERIEDLGIKTHLYDTLMTSKEKKKNLARFVLDL